MGMPGFSGFVAEIQVLIGAFKMSPWLCAAAALSIAVTAAYILNAIHKVFYGKDDEHSAQAGTPMLPAITAPEVVAAVILMVALVVIGLYPSAMLDMIQANVDIFLKGLP
jgi:NADH-quinone oxidoreductase subunit M